MTEWWEIRRVKERNQIYIFTDKLELAKDKKLTVMAHYIKDGKEYAIQILVNKNSAEHKRLIKELGLKDNNKIIWEDKHEIEEGEI